MKKVIKKSYGNFLLVIVFLILVIIVSVLFISNPGKYVSSLYFSEYIIFIIGLVSIIFTPFMLFLFLKRILFKNAMFIIDDEGIRDTVSIVDYPMIKWSEIASIEEKMNMAPQLLIYLKDPESYIRNVNNAILK